MAGLIGRQPVKLMGARLVIGTSTDPDRTEKLHAFRAGKVLNRADSDWANQVLAMTVAKGVELTIDHISGRVMNQNMKAVAFLAASSMALVARCGRRRCVAWAPYCIWERSC